MTKTLLIAAALAAAAAPTAHAAKVPTHRYTFEVELKGTQTTSWFLTHAANGACDADQVGDGKETVRFRGKTKLVAYGGAGKPIFVSAKGGQPTMSLRGTVNRTSEIVDGNIMGPEYCPDGNGEGDPPPDCGTRSVTGLKVTPTYAGRRRMRLEQIDSGSGVDYKRCFVAGTAYPYLLDEVKGRPVGQDLPPDELFEHGKHILLAKGVDRTDDGEMKTETKIRWELSLKRVKVEDLT